MLSAIRDLVIYVWTRRTKKTDSAHNMSAIFIAICLIIIMITRIIITTIKQYTSYCA